MKYRHCVFLAIAMIAGCKTVVTTTTEIRPSRYAVVEFTRLMPLDSALVWATRAAQAEGLKVQKTDRSTATVMAGPVKVPASADQPALDAQVTITARASGPETTVRVLASATLEANQQGGTDARLMELVQRVEKRIEALIPH